MKTPILTLMFASMFLAKFSFSQTQRLETTDEPRESKTTPVLYCGMVYFDDSTKVKVPSSRVDVKETPKKQTKKNLPTRSEKPAELRRED